MHEGIDWRTALRRGACLGARARLRPLAEALAITDPAWLLLLSCWLPPAAARWLEDGVLEACGWLG